MAVITAWARVEGNVHYPSDVLVGAALGNFIGMFIHDAFIGRAEDDIPIVSVAPKRGGATLVIGFRY